MNIEGKKMQIELGKGDYFKYGEQYYVQFNYGSEEQKKEIFDAFEKRLMPEYGSESPRAQEGKEHIMPYLVDENVIGGTSIPEDLLPDFIKRFVELYNATVTIGDNQMSDNFNYDEFKKMVDKLDLQIELRKGDYLKQGEQYYVQFNYGSEGQKKKIFDAFQKVLIPEYGLDSRRAKEGKEYIMPVDENGQMTTENTGVIGGTSIPKDLLPDFIKRFVELDNATVTIGDNQMRDNFNYDEFKKMVDKLDLQIELRKGDYIKQGEQYYVQFNYGSEEQKKKIFDAFEKVLIPGYGLDSRRSQEGKEYIMPVDENGQMTTENTRVIGGTSIPKDLLPDFIRRFVELDKATVTIGDNQMSDNFNYDEFKKMVDKLDLQIELRKGDYLKQGEQYYVQFNYGSEEQKKKIFDAFEKVLIPGYGLDSRRAKEGKEYIMPVDENGQMTTENTRVIGGTSIPEDLLPDFIKRFVELDKATVTIGDNQMSDNFNYDEFKKMVDKLGLQIELKKGDYFKQGEQYYVQFNYGSEEQKKKIFDAFEKRLIPGYGSNSRRAKEGKEYIMPYLVDENGQMTTENTGVIGGTSIPKDLLPDFIKMFVELDKATVTIGDNKISGEFNPDEFKVFIGNEKVQTKDVAKQFAKDKEVILKKEDTKMVIQQLEMEQEQIPESPSLVE